ncbi:MAG: hypothetical protein ACTSRA_22320 [Promethearchaeota archaeon]
MIDRLPGILEQKDRSLFDFQSTVKNIESISEYPVMCRALNSEPRTKHPFNVYQDICLEPAAIKQTLIVADAVTDEIYDELLDIRITRIINIGLPTSTFVGLVVSSALIRFCRLQSWVIDSTEFILSDIPYDLDTTAFFFNSGSGSTHDTNAAAGIIKRNDGYSVAITSVAGSSITEKIEKSRISLIALAQVIHLMRALYMPV